MSPRDSNVIAQGVNELNARRAARAESAAGLLVALVVGILLALALVHWATPCAFGTLCAAPVVTPLRTGLLQRLYLRWRAAYLRALIRWAEEDVEHLESMQFHIPAQLRSHRLWLEARRIELIDAELGSRRA